MLGPFRQCPVVEPAPKRVERLPDVGSPYLRDAGDVCTVDTWCMDVYARISDR